MTDFSELFLKVDLALGKRPDYLNTPRLFWSFHILSPPGLLVSMRHVHLYEGMSVPFWEDEAATTFLHGHSAAYGACPAPAFCHIYGYKPTGLENPVFIKLFNQKWKHIYNEGSRTV